MDRTKALSAPNSHKKVNRLQYEYISLPDSEDELQHSIFTLASSRKMKGPVVKRQL